MSYVKIAVIGAGSFVFGPSMLDQALRQHRLSPVEIVLVDPDSVVVELMAGVGRRMARESGVDAKITAHTRREPALAGADFVICSAAREMWRRFAIDCEIIERLAPGHMVSEFGGIQGISYSLRQIALIEEVCADMRRLCPQAWLLNAANPLPRMTQAAHERGIQTAGFCSVSTAVYGSLWRIFGGETLSFPYTPAQERWKAEMGGVNHFTWLVGLQERNTGADALESLRERLAKGATAGNPHSEQIARKTGWLLTSGDDHVKDFLPPAGKQHGRGTPGHGSPEERKQRLEMLQRIGEGAESYDALLAHFAWERPIDLVAALAFGSRAHFNSLNLVNTGQAPDLPNGVFVETEAEADSSGLRPRTLRLPDPVATLCRRTAELTDTIVRAAEARSRKRVHLCVDLDPTILDKAAGRAAIDACLEAHADILPGYL